MSDRMPPLRPLAGFGTLFRWGLRLTCRWPRLLAIGLPAIILCALLGEGYVGGKHWDRPNDEWLDLWILFDEGMLGYILPLIALLTIASGLRVEIGRKTLVYHLVRPVSRTTMFLARFASGVLPATVLSTVVLGVTCIASGLDLPTSVWLSLPATSFVTAVAVGAFYYVVTTLFRGGMIIALVYTFVFESLFAGTRGAMQKLSIMFHVRGVHHGLTDEVFKENSDNVVRALDPEIDLGSIDWTNVSAFQKLQERVAYDDPLSAFLICVCIAAGLLVYGAWRISQRDFPLKD